MLHGLADDKVDQYLDENPKLVPLFKIDVIGAVNPYVSTRDIETEENLWELDPKPVEELHHAREALEQETVIS